MSAIVCRRPVPAEADALCAFVRETIVTSFPTFTPEAREAYLAPWTPEGAISRLKRGEDILIVAVGGDEIIGVASGNIPEGGVGTIIWLLVGPHWRGRNAGRALYEAACGAYRELGAHKVKLTAPSKSAKRFYERCGMQLEGFHPNHWYNMDFYSLGAILDRVHGSLDQRHRITIKPATPPEREP
jgi:ribosomal protein S18 acetylase RimI-like enzyme